MNVCRQCGVTSEVAKFPYKASRLCNRCNYQRVKLRPGFIERQRATNRRTAKRKAATVRVCKDCERSSEDVSFSGANTRCNACSHKRYYTPKQRAPKKTEGELREVRAKAHKAYQARNLDKVSAQKKLRYAIKKGHIIRPSTCQFGCPTKPEAHHSDYNRPLDVMWLCPEHHRAWHRCFEPIRPTN